MPGGRRIFPHDYLSIDVSGFSKDRPPHADASCNMHCPAPMHHPTVVMDAGRLLDICPPPLDVQTMHSIVWKTSCADLNPEGVSSTSENIQHQWPWPDGIC